MGKLDQTRQMPEPFVTDDAVSAAPPKPALSNDETNRTGRKRIHADAAARQRAYRARQRQREDEQ